MLKQIARDVWVHESECLQSNATIVKGNDGVLLVDPGLTSDEMGGWVADIHDWQAQAIAKKQV